MNVSIGPNPGSTCTVCVVRGTGLGWSALYGPPVGSGQVGVPDDTSGVGTNSVSLTTPACSGLGGCTAWGSRGAPPDTGWSKPGVTASDSVWPSARTSTLGAASNGIAGTIAVARLASGVPGG